MLPMLLMLPLLPPPPLPLIRLRAARLHRRRRYLPRQPVVHEDAAEDDVEERLERLDDVHERERASAERHDGHTLAEAVNDADRSDGLGLRM